VAVMDETLQRLENDLKAHVEDEHVMLHLNGLRIDENTKRLEALSVDVNEIKTKIAAQKSFIGGAVFAVTAAGYVLVEGFKRMTGQ
jgi:hypothetical protein